MTAWHKTKDFPLGITEPLLFQETGALGEPQMTIGLSYRYVRHDDLRIIAALDISLESDEYSGVRYFYYDRKTGAAQLVLLSDPKVPVEIEIGTCTEQPK